MEEVLTHFGIDSLPEDEAGAYHTIGGFVMARLGRVPKTADAFEWGGMKFEVIDMDGRRIDKVLVTRKPTAQTPEGLTRGQHSGLKAKPRTFRAGTRRRIVSAAWARSARGFLWWPS